MSRQRWTGLQLQGGRYVSTKLDRSLVTRGSSKSHRKRYLDTARPRLGHNSVRRDAAVILLCVYLF